MTEPQPRHDAEAEGAAIKFDTEVVDEGTAAGKLSSRLPNEPDPAAPPGPGERRSAAAEAARLKLLDRDEPV
jgi:hypothetical protein